MPLDLGRFERAVRWRALRWHPRAWRSPAPAGHARVIRRGSSRERAVALTFDVGFVAACTAQVLDVLEELEVPSTFGVTGRWAAQCPGLLARLVGSGCQLVNHTHDHLSFTGAATGTPALASEERAAQLELADRVVRDLTGMTMRPWFRPPYGDFDRSVNADLASSGYCYNVLWTVDSLGWRGEQPQSIVKRCIRGAEPGAIYIFHVDSEADAIALPQIVSELRRRGYSFRTAGDLVTP